MKGNQIVKPVALAQLNRRKVAAAPKKVNTLSPSKLAVLAGKVANWKGIPALTPLMELTARHPYDPAGSMDFFEPGRWDCTYDLVFMMPRLDGPCNVVWGPSCAYVAFKAPANGTYLVAANVTGYKVTMKMQGPWGDSTAYSATTSSAAAVTAIWPATAGQNLYFTLIISAGTSVGYLKSFQMFLLS